jgi:L-2,4-diaminobutyrate decarboxylase
MRADAVIAEFETRIAGGLMNSQHPRQFGYFTPPPLPMSIMGELLAQVTNQGVDVWHAGPVAAFVEEEVVSWLCDLVGYDAATSFGLLTSGGVMANFMAMTLARDLHLGKLRGTDGPPRGAGLEGARVYTSDQTHFSIARALDELGFPRDTLVVLPADDGFRLRGSVVAGRSVGTERPA